MKAKDGLKVLFNFRLPTKYWISRVSLFGRVGLLDLTIVTLALQRSKKMAVCLAAVMLLFGGFCVNDCVAMFTYDVVGVSNNDPGNVAIGEAQLSVGLDDLGDGQVLFVFGNSGPEDASITDVYFDDRCGLLSGLSVENSAGVEFSQWASPSNLPAGNNLFPHFETTQGLSADSDPPVSHNGVNPGESLGIVFGIQSENGYIFDDITNCIASGDLRIGIKVQAFANGGSESFVVVPAPGAIVLGSIGICLIGWLRRRETL